MLKDHFLQAQEIIKKSGKGGKRFVWTNKTPVITQA